MQCRSREKNDKKGTNSSDSNVGSEDSNSCAAVDKKDTKELPDIKLPGMLFVLHQYDSFLYFKQTTSLVTYLNVQFSRN